jgi:hypothetical protein
VSCVEKQRPPARHLSSHARGGHLCLICARLNSMTLLEFLKLSWEIQLALASGYCAYVLAYTGLRDRQRPVDVAFVSLVFSLVATCVLWLLAPSQGPLVSSIAALCASILTGILWRRIGRDLVMHVLRRFDVTWQDDAPSALATLSANTKHRVSQVAVLLDDGDWLCCDDTRKFANSPFGPFQLGPNGDIAMYVTEIIPRRETRGRREACATQTMATASRIFRPVASSR